MIFLSASPIILPFLLCSSKPAETGLVEYRIIDEGKNAALEERSPNLIIFTDEQDFRNYYNQIHRTEIPRPETPGVDFEKYFVVFVSYGIQKTSGYSIEIRSVFTRKDTLVIKTILITPPSESFQAQVITHPYILVMIRRDYYSRIQLSNERGEILDSKSL
ncbi:MAG: protease complex subunit PrcB family protein [Spirochaetota bacterium]